MFLASTAVDKCKMDSEARKDSRLKRHRVKYRLDYFLDHFKGGESASLVRDVVFQYWGRGGRQSVITQEGVRDGLLQRREGWEVVVIVNTAG